MKSNYLIISLSVCVVLLGLAAGHVMPADAPQVIPEGLDHKRDRNPEIYKAASISKGTILLLLAVGVIGALGVSRTKKNNGNDLHRDAADREVQPPSADEDRQKLIGRNS